MIFPSLQMTAEDRDKVDNPLGKKPTAEWATQAVLDVLLGQLEHAWICFGHEIDPCRTYFDGQP